MKLWIWSDLHLEMQSIPLPESAPEGADVIVCAGDLCYAPHLGRWAFDIVHRYDLPLVFVPGNHEFYWGGSIARSKPSDHRLMREAAEASKSWRQPLIMLDDDIAEMGGVQFIGGTLWVDFRMGLEKEADLRSRMKSAPTQLADFSQIRLGDGERMSPQVMLGFNILTAGHIERELSIPFDGKKVVVTHHLPHPDCTPKFYRGSDANYLFACSEFVFGNILNSDAAPALWVCGHTHHPFDVAVGRTRIVSNPRGYMRVRDERENGFRWDLVIDTESLP
jgi:3',5'-cyclic AMP phosphodiesterase CpdA